uniref:Uncharacterized protein n=1 Tax=Anguilla anguilla TaxID=7936 RepID=A0A0E9VW29_ANGAN
MTLETVFGSQWKTSRRIPLPAKLNCLLVWTTFFSFSTCEIQ